MVLSTAVIMVIQRTRMGRLLGALADSPLALETQGATTNVIKVLVFCLSAAFASLAGALIAVEFHYAVGANYDPFLSLVYVALVVIAIGGEPWYALIAALGVSVIPGLLHLQQRHHVPPNLLRCDGRGLCRLPERTATVPLRVREFLDRLGGRRPEADGHHGAASTCRGGRRHDRRGRRPPGRPVAVAATAGGEAVARPGERQSGWKSEGSPSASGAWLPCRR